MEIKESIKMILNAGLTNQKIDIGHLFEDKNFMRIMREQTFQSWLYYVCPNENFQKYYLGSAIIHNQFDKMVSKMKVIFEKENIDYIILKGYSLQELYPDRNLRMLGDVDVLVREEDYKRAKRALSQSEFKLKNVLDHHSSFGLGQIEIELHHKMINTEYFFHDYFVDGFKHASLKEGNEYVLDDDYNFIFILAHYLKHLKQGAGLRELIDIYLMLNNMNINIDNVRNVLKEHNCENFFDLILHEIDILFGYNKIPYQKNKYVEEILDFSICSGIHGFGENNRWVATRMNNSSGGKFKFLLKTLFIPLESLFALYPWTKSIILIPFGYIYRFFFLLFKRGNRLKQVVNAKKNKKELSIFEKIGLNIDDIK